MFLNRILLKPASLILVTLFFVNPMSAVSSVGHGSTESKEQKQADQDSPWGIRVIGVRRTAADYMLEFRYRVLDAEKAAYIMSRKLTPELIIEKSGRKLYVPVSSKIGPLRQSPKFTKADRNYFMFFANPGRSVQAGDKVSVAIGDFNARNLIVE